MSDSKVYYLDNGNVMGVDPVDLARWYMDCNRKGDFNPRPPGENEASAYIHYNADDLSEYDDPEYFLSTMIRSIFLKDWLAMCERPVCGRCS